MYDYLIVGSGLYGAVFAHEAKLGKKCLVVEKRSHNCWKYLYKRDRRDPSASIWCTHFPYK